MWCDDGDGGAETPTRLSSPGSELIPCSGGAAHTALGLTSQVTPDVFRRERRDAHRSAIGVTKPAPWRLSRGCRVSGRLSPSEGPGGLCPPRTGARPPRGWLNAPSPRGGEAASSEPAPRHPGRRVTASPRQPAASAIPPAAAAAGRGAPLPSAPPVVRATAAPGSASRAGAGRAGLGRARPRRWVPAPPPLQPAGWRAAGRHHGSPFGLHPVLSAAERSVDAPRSRGAGGPAAAGGGVSVPAAGGVRARTAARGCRHAGCQPGAARQAGGCFRAFRRFSRSGAAAPGERAGASRPPAAGGAGGAGLGSAPCRRSLGRKVFLREKRRSVAVLGGGTGGTGRGRAPSGDPRCCFWARFWFYSSYRVVVQV